MKVPFPTASTKNIESRVQVPCSEYLGSRLENRYVPSIRSPLIRLASLFSSNRSALRLCLPDGLTNRTPPIRHPFFPIPERSSLSRTVNVIDCDEDDVSTDLGENE